MWSSLSNRQWMCCSLVALKLAHSSCLLPMISFVLILRMEYVKRSWRANTQLGLKTIQRWIRAYREGGLAGLMRKNRSDQGHCRGLPEALVLLVEGLALQSLRRPLTSIQRLGEQNRWEVPDNSALSVRQCQMSSGAPSVPESSQAICLSSSHFWEGLEALCWE